MADVTDRLGCDDRGQLLLITALALAVILLTVALLLNAAVYTENVATRETAADSRDAIAFRGQAVDGVADLIRTENRGGGDPAAVADGINATGPLVDRQQARAGVIANVSFNGTTDGRRLTADSLDTGNDWAVVEGVDEARNVTLTAGSLPTDPTDVEADALGVRFVTAGGNETRYVYEEGGAVVVDAANETHSPSRQCSIPESDPTTVDFTGDQLSAGSATVDCYRGLWPEATVEDVRIVNGGTADGTFAATVRGYDSVDAAVDTEAVVFAATIDLVYRTPEVDFETTVRVAPGEPR
ncbi:DUF7261 family protein [Halohasta salina]|uniref:DUF7261 family protein n=1 Tax=Halohasta salina TaxID=2961621 RepID=UPI0020A5EADA|nr:hypothetical protein [Halohasta salina]